MLFLRKTRQTTGDAQPREDEQQLNQDGFSAPVAGVTRRPWREEEHAGTAWRTPGCGGAQVDGQASSADAFAPAQRARRTRAAAHSEPAYALVGRRALEFADNGDGTLTVVRCIDSQADDLDIQFEAGACTVTAIASHAFEGCTALRRVVLPEGLRQIGEMAFSGCMHLSRAVIPGSVMRVGTLAFAKCASLTRVRIEPGVQALGPSCFSKCTSLVRVDIPASVEALGGGVFFGCGKQLRLYGAENTAAQRYAQLNGLAFDSQSWKEDEELRLEEREDGTLTVLGPRMEKPERIEIPTELCGRRITAIAPKAFFACGTLTHLSVGGGVREIGESAFFGCRSLVSVVFERGLERVNDSAFAGCESLTQVNLPWGTGSVGRMAFFGCMHLAFVKMPATTRVADFAFDGCAPGLRVFGGVSTGRAAQSAGVWQEPANASDHGKMG